MGTPVSVKFIIKNDRSHNTMTRIDKKRSCENFPVETNLNKNETLQGQLRSKTYIKNTEFIN